MPYLLSNSRYFVILLLSLLFLGCGTEGKVKVSEKIESVPQLTEELPELTEELPELTEELPELTEELPELTEELHVKQPPLIYINALPEFKLDLRQQVQQILDTGDTKKIIRAESDYVESLEKILVTLASYTPNHFGDLSQEEFISDIIVSRYQWHGFLESFGVWAGGRFAHVDSTVAVGHDVEEMIEEMVHKLCIELILEDKFNYDEWHDEWHKD